MTPYGYMQLVIFLVILLALVKPLGWYMARIYAGEPALLNRLLGPFERLLYRMFGSGEDEEMDWKQYAVAMLLFNLLGFVVVYALQRAQAALPLNPQALGATTPDLAFNTAASFISNTNWQSYGGEVTLSYLTQMLGLGVQNFVSAATGMAVLVALIRGISRRSAQTLGSFWVDMTRSTIYILLPLSVALALIQTSQGVVQTFSAYQDVPLLQQQQAADGAAVTSQTLPLGPASSQVAIKQLGTNGGGFFNVNSAHPFENPTPLSNLAEVLSILLIPAALCYTFGKMVGDTRQGWAVFAAMAVVFVALLGGAAWAEQSGNPRIAALGVDAAASEEQAGGNMEGKETRFGIANSALWTVATSAASNGSVNSMIDSYTPLGGMVPMFLIQLGEVVFGGAGSGLYGMLTFAIIAVFISGLMVGRTPEYLGKKIESYEMKMASLIILIPPAVVLIGAAVAVATPWGRGALYDQSVGYTSVYNPGAHGLSEVLYAFSSAGNNNGSAFAGLGANNPFYNVALGLAMLLSRYWLAIPTLAIAGALARKQLVPAGPGTLPTHGPLFVALLVGVVILVGALTFIPALALGPIVEHMLMVVQ
ncbi:potassium-transporting ATPase subunit KdpA [Chloroflexia bacterium SDU3-3]|nr:potassium-transporting ATPase subunit KdpA [Chloroflexia bacterium SDU3-3]